MAEVRPIDAQLLVYHLATEQSNAHPLDYNTNATYAECMKRVDAMPTLDYAPVRHGEWVERKEIFGDEQELVDAIGCSQCGKSQRVFRRTPYCPNCGAKMDGGEAQ